VAAAEAFAERVGYPVLVRPSYVLSGAAMSVIRSPDELDAKLRAASAVSPNYPVVISKFIENAQELDVDAVAANGTLLVHAVSEHIEPAGVHSGDATLVLPPLSVNPATLARLKEIAEKMAQAFAITGPFNRRCRWGTAAAQSDRVQSTRLALVSLCEQGAGRRLYRYQHQSPRWPRGTAARRSDADPARLCGHQSAPVQLDSSPRRRPLPRRRDGRHWRGSLLWSQSGRCLLGERAVHRQFPRPRAGRGIVVRKSCASHLLSNANRLGGDTTKPDLLNIVNYICPLGYRLYAVDPAVKHYIESATAGRAELIHFPLHDKRALRDVFHAHNIRGVFNLASARGRDIHDPDYVMRRNAVDFGIPLFLEPKVRGFSFDTTFANL
jgi:carbamoyl-phosphate synthase large subunit